MRAAFPRQRLTLWSRLGWAAGLVLFAVLAAGSAADRLSGGNPQLAAMVPMLFASEALRTLGAEALSGGQAVDAAAIGTAAIRNAPTDPQSTALLGAGSLAGGNRVLADRAFRVAGQLGWRVPITQSYWMGQALAEGKYDIAALRLDALLRQRQLIDPMERNPAGQTAMIARMQLNPAWLSFYAGDVDGLPADVVLQRTAVLDGAARTGLVLGCDRIAQLASRLAVVGQPKAGAALWRQHCPAAGSGLVADGQLTTLDITAKPTAFAWSLVGHGEMSLSVLPGGDGRGKRLLIEGMADVPRAVLTQLVVLDPGRYLLSWRSGNSRGQASDRILAAIVCPGEVPAWVTPTLDRTAGLWRAEVVVGAQCQTQQLTFAAAPRSGQIWLEQIALVRAP